MHLPTTNFSVFIRSHRTTGECLPAIKGCGDFVRCHCWQSLMQLLKLDGCFTDLFLHSEDWVSIRVSEMSPGLEYIKLSPDHVEHHLSVVVCDGPVFSSPRVRYFGHCKLHCLGCNIVLSNYGTNIFVHRQSRNDALCYWVSRVYPFRSFFLRCLRFCALGCRWRMDHFCHGANLAPKVNRMFFPCAGTLTLKNKPCIRARGCS